MEGYTPERLLGEGTFGYTQLILDKTTDKHYALKTIDLSIIESEDYNFSISQNTSRISHPNVVHYEDSFVDKQNKKWLILLNYYKSNVQFRFL
jgi:serine/threonine protein kinase